MKKRVIALSLLALFVLFLDVKISLADSYALDKPIVTSLDGSSLVNLGDRIEWTKVSGADYYRIGVVDVTNADKIVDNERTTVPYYKLSANKFKEGCYYKFAVGAYSYAGGESNWDEKYFTIKITQKPAPEPTEITYPKNGEIIDSSEIKVEWMKMKNAAYYLIGVRDLTTEEKLIDNEKTTNPYYRLSSRYLPKGHEIRFAVGAYNDSGVGGDDWAQVEFTVRNSKPTAPIIRSNSKSLIDKKTDTFLVTWNSVSANATYKIGIREKDSNSNVWTSDTMNGTSCSISNDVLSRVEEGNSYYIYATACVDDLESEESNRLEFSIKSTPDAEENEEPSTTTINSDSQQKVKPLAPTITSSFKSPVNKNTGAFNVSWSSVSTNAVYILGIRKAGSNSDIWTSDKINSKSYTLSAKEMSGLDENSSYFLYVKAIANGLESDESNTISFSVVQNTKPSAPALKSNLNVPISKNTGSFIVSWNSVDSNALYNLVIRKPGSNSDIWTSDKVSGTSYTISANAISALEKGNSYYIYATASVNGIKSDESSPLVFSVAQSAKPSAPVIRSDFSGTVDKNTGSFTVSWNSVGASAFYNLGIRKSDSNSDIWTSDKISGTSCTISAQEMSDLEEESNYYIYVIATVDDLKSDESNRFVFSTKQKEKTITSIRPSVQSINLEQNGSTEIVITAFYDNGESDDVTENVSWNMTQNNVVRYEGRRLYSSGNAGSTIVSASYKGMTCNIDVTVDSINDIVIQLTIGSSTMYVNGAAKEVDSGRATKPIIKNERTLLPIKAIIESLGGEVGWNASKKEVTISYNGKTIKVKINSYTAEVDGSQMNMDVAPIVVGGRTMLPIRFIAENLGLIVDWDNAAQMVTIKSAEINGI